MRNLKLASGAPKLRRRSSTLLNYFSSRSHRTFMPLTRILFLFLRYYFGLFILLLEEIFCIVSSRSDEVNVDFILTISYLMQFLIILVIIYCGPDELPTVPSYDPRHLVSMPLEGAEVRSSGPVLLHRLSGALRFPPARSLGV